MAPERRKRAITKPAKPPKQKAVLPPPLPPIAPAEEEEAPQPRKRGRPKGQSEGPISLPCPFAAAGRDNPCPTYPDPVDKGRVKRHLANIRLRVPGILSGNETHPQNDPLWDTEYVKDLVSRRLPKTEEDQKLRLKERNHKAYKKSTNDMRLLRAKLEGFVNAKKMNQDDMDSVMLSRLHGQYRVKYREEILERKRLQSLAELEKEKTERHNEQQAFEELQNRTKEFQDHMQYFRDHAQYLTNIISQIFNPVEHVNSSGHLQRNGFNWPTLPSPQAFYDLYAISVPIASWPPDGADAPDISLAFQAASLALHPDKASQYTAALGDQQKMQDISKTLQASREMVDIFLMKQRGGTEAEKKEYLRQLWEVSKYKVLQAMRPNSSSIPPFLISWLVDEAAVKGVTRPQQQQPPAGSCL